MATYSDQMFNATANATALTQFNSGITATAGVYNVPLTGRMIKITVLLAGQAASSLLEAIRCDLLCTTFLPNIIRVGGAGGALRTAPAFPIPIQDWAEDQPVNTAQPISGSYLFNVTAVTPNVQIFGTFTTPG